MNQSGHIKGTSKDENTSYRQFIINCLGNNDQRKYLSISPFGFDFNAPENTRALTADSRNKDVKYNLGVLNKIRVEDLEAGESVIFSTDEAGEELKSKIVLRNTGDIEINKGLGGVDIGINADGTLNVIASGNVSITVDGNTTIETTGDVNLNADGNVIVTSTQLNVNGGNLTVD